MSARGHATRRPRRLVGERRSRVGIVLMAIPTLVASLLVGGMVTAAPAFAVCTNPDGSAGSAADCTATMTLTKDLATGQTDGDTGAGNDPILFGDEVRYELQFQCSSLTVDCGTLTIVDTLDPRLDFVGASASITEGSLVFGQPQTTTDPVTGAITVTMIGTPFNAGDSGSVFLTTRVRSGVDTSTPITNGASAFATSTVIVEAPVDVEVEVEPGVPDWRLTKTRATTPFTTDQIVFYQLQLRALTPRGNVAVDNATVVDHYPAGAEVMNADGTVVGDGETTDSGGVVDTTAHTITWQTGPVSVTDTSGWGAPVRLRFPSAAGFVPDDPGTAEINEGTSVTNSATIDLEYADGSLGDEGTVCTGTGTAPGSPNPSCTVTTQIGFPITQAQAVKSKAGGLVAIAGQSVVYTVGVNIAGSNQPVGGVLIQDSIPAGMDLSRIRFLEAQTSPSWRMEYSTQGPEGPWISFNTLDDDPANDDGPSWDTGDSVFNGTNAWPVSATYPNDRLGNFSLTQEQWDVLNDPDEHVTDVRMVLLGDLPSSVGTFGFEISTQIDNPADVPGTTEYLNCIRVTAGAGVSVYSQGEAASAGVVGGVGTACANARSTTEFAPMGIGKQTVAPPTTDLTPGTEVPFVIGIGNQSPTVASSGEVVVADLLPKGLTYLSTDCINRGAGTVGSGIAPTNSTTGWRCSPEAWDTGIGDVLAWFTFGGFGTSRLAVTPTSTTGNTTTDVPEPDIDTVIVDGEERQLLTWTLTGLATNQNANGILFRTTIDPGTPVGPLTNQAVAVAPNLPTVCQTGGTQVIPGTDEEVGTSGGSGTSVADAALATLLGLDADNPGCFNAAEIDVVGNAFVSAQKWISGTLGLPDVYVANDDPSDPLYGTEAEVPARGTPATSDVCPVLQNDRDVIEGQTFTRYPCVGQVIPGGEFQYRWVLTNTGNTPLHDYVVYDVFPYVGDTGVSQALTQDSRDTEWEPDIVTALEPIDAETGEFLPVPQFSVAIEGLPAGTDPVVTYSKSFNPCRPELNSGSLDADWSPPGAACDAPDTPAGKWYLGSEIDAGVDGMTWVQVHSLRAELFWAEEDETEWCVAVGVCLPVDGDGDGVPGGFAQWMPGDTLVAEMTMRAPSSAPISIADDPDTPREFDADGKVTGGNEFNPSVAWNSVAHRVFRVNDDGTITRQLAAEPQKVGIIMPYNTVPDVDIEKYSGTSPWSFADDAADDNGLDDDGQPNSVPEDFDTDVKRIPAGRSHEIRFTVTNTGFEDLTDMTLVDRTNTGIPIRDVQCDLSDYYPGDPARAAWDFGSPAFSLAEHDEGIAFRPGDAFDCTATLPGLNAGTIHSDTVRVDALGWPTRTPVTDADDWNAQASATGPRAGTGGLADAGDAPWWALLAGILGAMFLVGGALVLRDARQRRRFRR